jgi:hypothetical protein
LIEDPALDPGIERLQAPGLAVLLRHQLLIEGRDLDVAIERREIEVGREPLRGITAAIPFDVERRRLVGPLDLIEVEQLGELKLAVVRKPRALVGKKGARVVPVLLLALGDV